MIKAIMNIIGLKKNDIVLDPMCGSGTTNVEAALMGINSVGVDISPFCILMASVKARV
jgi:tRNA G10  N-methylase Trm11